MRQEAEAPTEDRSGVSIDDPSLDPGPAATAARRERRKPVAVHHEANPNIKASAGNLGNHGKSGAARLARVRCPNHTLAMVRATPDALFEPFRGPETAERPCQHEGCPGPGLHRGPMSRDRLTDYDWFCLEHIREYNQAWDYFVGMNEEEIEAQRRTDTVWERPSWPFGGDGHKAEARAREDLHREFGGPFEAGREPGRPRSKDEKALALLNLKRPITFPEIKARYIELVKQLHPDANGGDKEAEERLKLVNEAFSTLKHSFVQ